MSTDSRRRRGKEKDEIKTNHKKPMQKREKAGLTRLLTGKVLSILSIGAILFVSLFVVLQDKPKVQAATASTLNFQARLLNSSGAIVPDGYYNIEFNLYSASSGGSTLWTETWYDSNGVTAGNDNRIQVRSGYVSVYLGNQTAFPGTINWDQDLYLTMNVGGTTQTATPTWDGEMNPRLKLTAVPYAFRAGQLAKLTGGNTSTLDFATQTGARSLLLPDESGTLCVQSSSNCGFNTDTSITLQDAYNATSGNSITTTDARDLNITLANTATDANMLVNIATGSSGRFAVQNNGTDVLGVTTSAITLSANVSVAGSNTLTVGTGATTLGGSLLANGDATIGNATTDRLTVTSQILGASPLVFQGATDNGFATTFTFTDPTANNTITFPDASGTVQLAPASGNYLFQVPTSTAANTITPTANSVVGLTVNGTSGTAATAAIINQTQAADGLNINTTNGSGTQTNGLAITRNGAGTTTNLLNLTNTSGTATNALNISGTFTNYISATNLTVTNAGNADFAGTLTAGTADAFQVNASGAVTAVGVNSGSGLLQGTGGLTLTGAISVTNNGASTIGLNTGTSTGAVNIGNSAAGAITLQSGTSTEVIGAVNTTGQAGSKALIIDSAATSTYTVVPIQVANTDRAYILADSAGDLALYGTGAGALYLNYGGGTGGIVFGSGANTTVGTVSSTGNADFEGTLTAGTTNAFTVAATGDITTGGDLALNGGDITSTVALNIGSGTNTALTLNSGTTGTINIGTDASAETINIGNTGAAVKTIYIGDSANANVVRIGSTTGAATTTIQGGSGGIVLSGTVTGAASDSILCKNGSNQISTCGGNTLSGYVTLQNAYANGNSITTTDNRNVTISLADTATDADLVVDLLGTGNTFEIRDGGSAFFTAADGGTITQTFTGTATTASTINAASLSTGSGLSVVGSTTAGITGASNGLLRATGDVGASGTGGQLVYLAPDFSNVGAAAISYGIQNAATDSTAVANTDYGYYGSLTLTGNAAKVGVGAALVVSSSSTTADTLAGVSSTVNVSGAISTGTRTNYGIYSGGANSAINTGGTTNTYGFYGVPTTTGANSGGTQNLYGSYLAPSSTNSTAGSTVNVYGQYLQPTATLAAAGGTINQYGLYVANGTSSTNGTSTKYGLYVESPTGADNNYAAAFAGGNVGIGTTTPGGSSNNWQLDVQSSNTAGNGIRVLNTDTGNNYSAASIVLQNSGDNDALSQGGRLFKTTTGYTGYKTVQANDLGFMNNRAGNISILNDASDGNVLITTRGSSTPNVRIDDGSSRVLTGSIDPIASRTVTGSGTKFLTELMVGDTILVSTEYRVVTSITNDTSLTVDVAFTDNGPDASPDRVAPALSISNTTTAVSSSYSTNFLGGSSNITVNPGSSSNANYLGFLGSTYSTSSNLTTGSLSGVVGVSTYAGSGTLGVAIGSVGQVRNLSTGTIGFADGMVIKNAINSGGGTITNQFGLVIEDMTSATTTNVGLLIYDASTYSLQLASNDNDAASGITFGSGSSSVTANLYRSANDTLKTDDNFVIGSGVTFGTNSSDSNCFTGGSRVASTCTMTTTSVDSYTATIVGFTTTGQVAAVQDPTVTTAGKVIYVTASSTSSDFTLCLNNISAGVYDGSCDGTGNSISMRANTTATLIWNGSDWTAAGASSSTTLQAGYDNTLISASGAELVLAAGGSTNADGLTIRNNATTAITGALLEVQTSAAGNLISINNNATEYAANGGSETAGSSSTTYPSNTWSASATGGTQATVSRTVTSGEFATGQAGVKVVTTGATTADQGAADQIAVNGTNTALTANLKYYVSFAVKGTANFTTLDVVYSKDGTNTSTTSCATGKTVTESVWSRVTCSFTAPSSGITSSNAIFIRQSNSNTVARTFYIDNLSVNTSADVNHAADGDVDSALGTNWTQFDADGGAGTTTLTRDTSNIYNTSGAVSDVTTTHVNEGLRNNLTITPTVSTQYLVTFYAKLASGTFTDLTVGFLPAGGNSTPAAAQLCKDYNTQTLSTTAWTKITCLITTPSSGISDPDLVIYQPTATARTFYVDALSITLNTNTASNVQVGGANKGGPTTLFTLDRASNAPIADNNDAYLGSMYYDTTTGRIQCYESDGWGACGAAPDNYVNLNPEYAGAVLNGSGVGTMTSDFCANQSGVLQVNYSASTDPCYTSGDVRNYYKWTSPQATQQTYSIYVTYQLPATFRGFSSDDTVQLTARADSTSNAAVTYQMFAKQSSGSLAQCGSGETTVVTSTNTWQSVGINGNEATGCSLTSSYANGFIIFKINMKANSNATAYVSTLSFTTTGN